MSKQRKLWGKAVTGNNPEGAAGWLGHRLLLELREFKSLSNYWTASASFGKLRTKQNSKAGWAEIISDKSHWQEWKDMIQKKATLLISKHEALKW